MKYCAPCRHRAKDDDEKCARCGGPLRQMGPTPNQRRSPAQSSRKTSPRAGSAPSRPNPQQAEQPQATQRAQVKQAAAQTTESAERSAGQGGGDVQFQLAGLEQKVQRSSLRVKILAAIALLLAVSFTGLLFYMRHSYIMQFAEVDQLEIVRSEIHTGTALIRFRPLTEGRIQFVRIGGGRQETLLEYSDGPTPEGEFRQFHWTGDADGSWSISIRHRDGSNLVDRDWSSADRKPVKREDGGVLASI